MPNRRTSLNSVKKLSEKGVRVRLRVRVWPVFGGQNGPCGAAAGPQKATFLGCSGLFGQFQRQVRRIYLLGNSVHERKPTFIADSSSPAIRSQAHLLRLSTAMIGKEGKR